jgi:hypothetical protein
MNLLPWLLVPLTTGAEPMVVRWDRWELALEARAAADPDTAVTAELTAPDGRRFTVDGFWNGASEWRIRYRPYRPGRWTYIVRSRPAVAGLDGTTGAFTCTDGAGGFSRRGPIRVADDGRYFVHFDGTPFFWLGDTVWNGPLLATNADWDVFLADRKAKRFSVIQFNMVAPWRTAPTDADGQVAYTGKDKIAINPKFFQRMDARMDAINANGLLAVPVLLWAIRGEANPGFSLPEDQAIKLAKYMVARYGAHHVAWILAGDGRYSGTAADRWRRIGRAVFGDVPNAPVTMHGAGMDWPFEEFRGEKWFGFIGYQSGHGDDARTLRWIHSGPASQSWTKTPAKPTLNIEPPYEAHLAYQSKQPHSAYNVRRACYWSLFATPTAGLTYGGHGIWSWQTQPGLPREHPNTGIAQPWSLAKDLPGSQQMKHLAELFTSFEWWKLRPAPELVTEQPGRDDPAKFVAAGRTEDGNTALLYLPVGGEVRVRPDGRRTAEWFDPRSGKRTAATGEDGRFRAPDAQDWLLVLRNQ